MKYISTNQNQNFIKKIYIITLVISLLLLPFIGFAQATKVTFRPADASLTTSLTTTWQVPANVYYITVECIGGGGAGGNGYYGGGGGAYSYKAMEVTPGTVYYIQAGGAGAYSGTNGGTGGTGGDSWFKTGSQSGAVVVLAKAGTGGTGNNSTKGKGGLASAGTGDIRYSGGDCGDVASNKASGGGGAGGFGGNGDVGRKGSEGSWTAASGGPGNPYSTRGKGGRSCDGCTNGWTGEWYGGGGGGSTGSSNRGGNGGPGAVIITYYAGTLITPITGNNVLCSGTTTQLTVNLPTGGTITTPNISGTDYRVHSFTTENQFDFFITGGNLGNVTSLIVGGGGGGGRNGGGGGGAGEYIAQSTAYTLNKGTTGYYPVFVGDGGGIGYNFGGKENTGYRGGISYFNGITANGGGGGANRDGGGAPMTGGSGGGGANAAGSGWSEQNGNSSAKLGSGNGNAGGNGEWSTASWSWYGGGGGGASTVGISTKDANRNTPGHGGNGISNSITGSNVEYAAGGGGSPCCVESGNNTYPSKGGSNNVGGGNNGSNGVKAPNANTGSGGMGGGTFISPSNTQNPQAGAAGIVIIRYPLGTWSSNATGVATVDQTGKVTAGTTAGTATISYTIGGQTYGTYDITVAPNFTSGTLVSTAQTICYNTQPSDISYSTAPANGTVVAGKTSVTYQWYKQDGNITAPSGDFIQGTWATIGSAITAPTAPTLTGATIGNLTTTTTFALRVTTTVTNGSVTSTCYDKWAGNRHLVSVYNQFTAGAINTTGQTICYNTTPSQIGNTTAASGGASPITYSWRSSADGYTNAISGASASTLAAATIGNLTATTTFRRYANDASCNTTPTQSTGEWTVTVQSDPNPGNISGAQTICYNTTPTELGSVTAGTGSGDITYQWQSSTDGTTFNNINTATNATYQPGNLTATRWYRRNTVSTLNGKACTSLSASNVVEVTVQSAPTAGSIGSGNTPSEIICNGDVPQTIASITNGTGDGTITYRWQSSTTSNSTGFSDISGENGATLSPSALTQNTWYRRYTVSTLNGKVCESVATTAIQIRVHTATSGSINPASGTTICHDGTINITNASTGTGTGSSISYKWEKSTTSSSAGFSVISGAFNAVYTENNVTQTTWYRRTTISNVSYTAGTLNGTIVYCESTPTNVVQVTVQSVPTAGAISVSDVATCPGTNITINSTTDGTGDGTISYKWEKSTIDAVSGFSTVVGQTGATYTFTRPTSTTWYRRVTVSTLNTAICLSVRTDAIVVYADNDANGILANVTSTRICEVKDNNWHYFRNDAGEIIAGINSQNVDLGNVTITVHVETTAPEFRDGGHGREDACFGKPELAVRRWYEITPSKNAKNIPAGSPTLVKLYFTDDDYSEYVTKISGWDATHPTPLSYGMCYGTTNGKGDLVVSKDEVLDLSPTSYNIDQTKQFTEYQIAVPSFSTFHFHTNGGIGGPLPIELLSFTGIYNSIQNINELTWITASEKNTNRFEVEKSLDGENWTTIGSVNAIGNVTENTTYNFDDNNPLIGNNYYRLKSIDNDASFEYSNIVRIQVKGDAIADEVAKIFPNPTNAILNVWLVATQAQSLLFNINDALGRNVQQFEKQVVGGMNKLEFDVRNLSSGTYLLNYIDTKGNKHHYKFVKD